MTDLERLAEWYGYPTDGQNILAQAMSMRDLDRRMARDGTRVMLALAPYLRPGDDPAEVVMLGLEALGRMKDVRRGGRRRHDDQHRHRRPA